VVEGDHGIGNPYLRQANAKAPISNVDELVKSCHSRENGNPDKF